MYKKELKTNVLITATTPISHFDPGISDGSNTLSFNRKKQIVKFSQLLGEIEQWQIDDICKNNLVPAKFTTIFEGLNIIEFTAISIVRLFIDEFNKREGIGYFAGKERYEKLADRVRQAALRSSTFLSFWGRLSGMMGVNTPSDTTAQRLINFYGIGKFLQIKSCQFIAKEHINVVTIARVWSPESKLGNPQYAKSAGKEIVPQVEMSYSPINETGRQDKIVIELPHISTNDLRHHLRESTMNHMFMMLGLEQDVAGFSELPPAINALFENGGNLEQGAKRPSNSYILTQDIRNTYPFLSLFGGNVVRFDLGKGDLSMSNHIVCTENADYIKGVESELSVFDLLNDVTETRHASKDGEGQMIRNFETLVTGTQIMINFYLQPFTHELVQGCFVAGLTNWLNRMTIAGQSARGYGHMVGEILDSLPNAQESLELYEQYLIDNKEMLYNSLVDGTLCTNTVLAK